MNKNFLPLTPIIHSWIQKKVDQPLEIFELIEEKGSPINLHHVEPLYENLCAYEYILKKYDLKHRIFFARKANKCIEIPIFVARHGQGVDTASFRELQQCIDAGIPSEQLLLTAAVKNQQLLRLAAKHQITTVIDNEDELELAQQVAEESGQTITINIRIGGFIVNDRPLPTRFGYSVDSAFQVITNLSTNYPNLHYTGIHFHLNGYAVDERVAAIEQSIQLIDRLTKKNVQTHSLDIGGGILMNYLKSEEEWENFHHGLQEAVLERREEITYQNDPLGIIKIDNELYGRPTVYPYFNTLHKADLLETILSSHSDLFDQPIHKLFSERQLEFRMEPGRSLLDQVGCTIAKVAFRKKDHEGRLLIGLEMNRTQLRSSSADFLLDPIHIPHPTRRTTGEEDACYGYLVGSYCLEQELILKRKVRLQCYPAVGDLILFPNTAGYMMHFYESEAHLFELAKNVFHGIRGE